MAQIHVDLISGHETSDNDNVQEYDFEDSIDSTNKIAEYTEVSYEEYDSSDKVIMPFMILIIIIVMMNFLKSTQKISMTPIMTTILVI